MGKCLVEPWHPRPNRHQQGSRDGELNACGLLKLATTFFRSLLCHSFGRQGPQNGPHGPRGHGHYGGNEEGKGVTRDGGQSKQSPYHHKVEVFGHDPRAAVPKRVKAVLHEWTGILFEVGCPKAHPGSVGLDEHEDHRRGIRDEKPPEERFKRHVPHQVEHRQGQIGPFEPNFLDEGDVHGAHAVDQGRPKQEHGEVGGRHEDKGPHSVLKQPSGIGVEFGQPCGWGQSRPHAKHAQGHGRHHAQSEQHGGFTLGIALGRRQEAKDGPRGTKRQDLGQDGAPCSQNAQQPPSFFKPFEGLGQHKHGIDRTQDESCGQCQGVACRLFGDDAHGVQVRGKSEGKVVRRIQDDAMFAVFGVRFVLQDIFRGRKFGQSIGQPMDKCFCVMWKDQRFAIDAQGEQSLPHIPSRADGGQNTFLPLLSAQGGQYHGGVNDQLQCLGFVAILELRRPIALEFEFFCLHFPRLVVHHPWYTSHRFAPVGNPSKGHGPKGGSRMV